MFAHRKAAVTKIVKTESCFMNVMTRTVQLAVPSAQTVLLLIYKSVGKLAANTELELKLSRPRIVVMVFELTVASILIKSLLSTLGRLSQRMSVIDEPLVGQHRFDHRIRTLADRHLQFVRLGLNQ